MDSQRALFTLSCTVVVACGSSTIVGILDRWLYEEVDKHDIESKQISRLGLWSKEQDGVPEEEALGEDEPDGPGTLNTLKEDFKRRMKKKEQEETKLLESNVLSVLPRVFRLAGQHILTPLVLKRLDQIHELYF
ncbi:hypothetical protein GAYE_SCF17G3722 [Galdieria yellowstonensis]|uniref:Uncharacterized protein n=1 Tax=Galdieria yellowstonensis TaxID=3028027 RepID=A0AAV9IEL3_9RHOD|nr:hypothetical protein GAYE_SCF17G3722 [Galdieria yellowstonensis]